MQAYKVHTWSRDVSQDMKLPQHYTGALRALTPDLGSEGWGIRQCYQVQFPALQPLWHGG